MVTETVPTARRTERVVIDGGKGALLIRRAKKTDVAEIMRVAGLTAGDTASDMRFTMMMFRWAVVDAQGVIDAETGEAAECGPVRHPVLGMIANEAVYNAVTNEVVLAVFFFAMSGRALPEELLGKS